ncbi:hypothetical protein [Kalamiella sp. sgz302252]|uniref:hypothetical protein n=1 Tax=Pantoea sp. sgz302252 TaxID=3341827 RepID=UPI0036D22383
MKNIALAFSLAFSVTLLSGCAHWGAHDTHSPPPPPPGSLEQPSGAPGGTSPVGELRD